jgi:hypothetical protein
MIIPVYSQDLFCREAFVICLKVPVDEATFLRRGKVRRGSYAGDLLVRLYAAIFRQSLRLERDYRKYYSVEYATFSEYVDKRLSLSGERLDDIYSEFDLGHVIIYFCSPYCFLSENYGLEFLTKLLEHGGGA